jgi:hypothetical protein
MVREACPWTWRDGRLAIEIELPLHSVAAPTVDVDLSLEETVRPRISVRRPAVHASALPPVD